LNANKVIDRVEESRRVGYISERVTYRSGDINKRVSRKYIV